MKKFFAVILLLVAGLAALVVVLFVVHVINNTLSDNPPADAPVLRDGGDYLVSSW